MNAGASAVASLYKGDELADPATMVVAKVFHQATNDPQRFRTFLREVRGMRLRHPHIGQIIDSGQIADRRRSTSSRLCISRAASTSISSSGQAPASR
ncbi:hypothetical protein ACBJ59_04610 [Nonomuraea sp. MTCD27]|uniref:hypothetical protein n=1 Tax=Nonomuraea sp. MTCD27 TaxID=1676747 RepID=UPI0035BFE2ED